MGLSGFERITKRFGTELPLGNGESIYFRSLLNGDFEKLRAINDETATEQVNETRRAGFLYATCFFEDSSLEPIFVKNEGESDLEFYERVYRDVVENVPPETIVVMRDAIATNGTKLNPQAIAKN